MRTPTAELLGTGHLPEWSLQFNKRSIDTSAKCNIQQSGGGLYVAVYRMSAADKENLDRIEGVGKGYAHAAVDVPGFGECRTYIAADSHVDESLLPYDWYREMVLLGGRALSLPTDYIGRIERIPVVPDPDLQRRRANWEIVDTLQGIPGVN